MCISANLAISSTYGMSIIIGGSGVWLSISTVTHSGGVVWSPHKAVFHLSSSIQHSYIKTYRQSDEYHYSILLSLSITLSTIGIFFIIIINRNRDVCVMNVNVGVVVVCYCYCQRWTTSPISIDDYIFFFLHNCNRKSYNQILVFPLLLLHVIFYGWSTRPSERMYSAVAPSR